VKSLIRRNLLFGLIAVSLLLIILELILRLAVHVSVDYISRKDDVNYEYRLWQMHLFDSFMGMQEFDPDLFWRMKAGYRSAFVYVNELGFSGPEVKPRQPNEFRILFLGDSTPLGLGLPKSTGSFVWQVRALVQKAIPDRSIVVINGAVAGYTSWQCRRLLELRGKELQPDLVITYFGNNDASYNGYLSDRQLAEMTRNYGWINRILGKSYCYQLLKNLILRFKEPPLAIGKPKERVSVTEFRDNLEAIGSWCHQNGCGLMTCSVPTPNLWPPGVQFKVFASGKDNAGRLVMPETMLREISAPWELCLDTTLLPGTSDQWTQRVYAASRGDTLAPAVAELAFRSLLMKSPRDPRLQNNLAVSLWREGRDSAQYLQGALAIDSLQPVPWYNLGVELYRSKPAEAIPYLRMAKELDHYSLRIKAEYNLAMRDFCATMGTPLVDLERAFDGLPEREYFVDHCHPTSEGHELIARQIAQTITKSMR
jgi:lysophospholipase L1-like esterase